MPSSTEAKLPRQDKKSELIRNPRFLRVVLAMILGALGSLPLIILTPPFQVPDEVQHFYRAYQISELHIHAEVQNGVSGGTIPSSLPKLVQSCVFTRDAVFYPATPAPLARTLSFASIPLNSSARSFVPFPGSAFYSPLPYLPQVLGIELGRLFGAGPLYLLYLGRLFNCLAALALLGLSVYFMPFAEELVIIVGLLPMSLYLYASLSADSAVIGCALLFSALSFSAGVHEGWRARELATAALIGAVLCSVKPPYVPLLLASVVPGLFQRKKVVTTVRSNSIVLAAALGATGLWLSYSRSAMTTPLGGGHPSNQLAFLLHHPSIFIGVLINTLITAFFQFRYFYDSTVGKFGWLTVPLQPEIAYILPLVNFVILWSLGVPSSKRSSTRSIWYLALAISTVFLIMVAMYLMASQVGQREIVGVQGRYLIPILPLIGMAAMEVAPQSRPAVSMWMRVTVIFSIIALQIVAMDRTIIQAFRLFS